MTKRLTTNSYCNNALRRNDYIYGGVERWIPYRDNKRQQDLKFRQDFAGFADILAWHPRIPGVLAIQTCAYSGLATHVNKLEEDATTTAKLIAWLRCKNRFEIWGWKKALNASNRIAMCMFPRRAELQDSLDLGLEIIYHNHETEIPDWRPARPIPKGNRAKKR